MYIVFDCSNDVRLAETATGVMPLVGPLRIFVEPAEDFVEPDGAFLEHSREFGEPGGACVEPLEWIYLGFCGTSRGFGSNPWPSSLLEDLANNGVNGEERKALHPLPPRLKTQLSEKIKDLKGS